MKPFVKDLKAIYQAPSEEMALEKLDELEEKWGKKSAASVASWRKNWSQLSESIYLAMVDITKKRTGASWKGDRH